MTTVKISTFCGDIGRALTERLLAKWSIELPPKVGRDEGRRKLGLELQNFVQSLDEKERYDFEALCQRLELMTDEAAEISIEDVGRTEPGLYEVLFRQPSNRSRAAYLFHCSEDLFREAEHRRHSRHYRRSRFWHRFRIDAPEASFPDPEAIEANANFLAALRRAHPDRRDVAVEACRAAARPDEFLLSIAAPDPPRRIQYYENRQFSETSLQLTNAATVVFDRSKGLVEVVGKGWRAPGCRDVAEAFVELALGLDVHVTPVTDVELDLAPLIMRSELDLDPQDKIERVTVTQVRWPSATGRNWSISIDDRTGEPPWLAAGVELGDEAVDRLKANPPSFVQLQITPKPREGERPRPFYASLHRDGKTNLREITRVQSLILEKYLPRWGVVETVVEPLIDHEH